MFSSILSASINGLEVLPVRVETDISGGLPQFNMVGYPNAQVREAEERVRSSFHNCGYELPSRRITVNLSPADVPKSGSRFDLPIALSMLAASGVFPASAAEGVMAAGELSLNGTLNPVSGILPIAMRASEENVRCLIVPSGNLKEASAVSKLPVIGISSLQEGVEFLRHGELPQEVHGTFHETFLNHYPVDFADIRGQRTAKRAASISVAGFHNFLLIGSPGSGKTMIARRIPTILPELTTEESLEISRIYSIAGLLSEDHPIVGTRPFRHPHHTISPQALAGGGKIPTPGEVTLAHRGVLFLDEFPEFSPSALEVLRQPLEDREIVISRTSGSYRFPANFLLLAAMNPCRCGNFGTGNCTCSSKDVKNYIGRISRPLLDRIDICVKCPPVSYEDLIAHAGGDVSSEEIRCEVDAAREIQLHRFRDCLFHFNSEIPVNRIPEFCPLDVDSMRILESAFRAHALSARGFHRTIKVARTIADLEGSESIRPRHIDEALMYRTIDETFWRL